MYQFLKKNQRRYRTILCFLILPSKSLEVLHDQVHFFFLQGRGFLLMIMALRTYGNSFKSLSFLVHKDCVTYVAVVPND